jgi:Dyp-type peroxidase family
MADTLELGDIQGLVARGYSTLLAASFVTLRVEEPAAARAWLGALAGEVATAEPGRRSEVVQVALTASGLERLGLPERVLQSFPDEFAGGMTARPRRRILGDVGESAPEKWSWGGPANPVDALLLLYAEDAEGLAALADRHAAAGVLRDAGLAERRRLDTAPLTASEPFGFHDGISQPAIAGLGGASRPEHTVRAGEFVLGYPNEYGRPTDSPTVEDADDPAGLLARTTGRPDLGRNGSYLVVRQLSQDVEGFWRFVEQASRDDGGAERLAAKMVGRWPDGTPLVVSPDNPDPEHAGANNFGYALIDSEGTRCPVGAHVRRANPRDALDPEAGPKRSIAFSNRHRLLRRGRAYGDAEAGERGIHFLCLNANIARQFEFVQHTWLDNPKFGGLYDDTDPLVATRQVGRTFTIPARPVRERVTGLPSFVTVRGGAYFFLPGLRALRYLAALPDDLRRTP